MGAFLPLAWEAVAQSAIAPSAATVFDSATTNAADRAQADTAAKVAVDSVALWLASHAIRLRTVEAGNGFADMQPLRQLVGGARVVALGESTHGTREFFQLKHRMLEFLVADMGFTVFGIEATMPEAFAINEYVLTGKGNPARALAGLYFWTVNTEEVLDMIRWMRQYNADHRHVKKVKFYGFDMTAAPLAAKVTLSYLRKVDIEQATGAEQALAWLANPIMVDANVLTDKRAEASTAIRTALGRFDAHKSEYVGKTSEHEWAVARLHGNIVAQYLEMRKGPRASIRDSSMAANIRWILDHEGPETKMVVWAHNGHVSTGPTSDGMGNHLRSAFGPEMVVFGFAFNQGSFQAIHVPFGILRAHTVGPAPSGSLDEALAVAGLQMAAVDLRALPTKGIVAQWFATPQQARDVGSGYTDDPADAGYFLRSRVTPKAFDALLFVEKTSAARPNPNSFNLARPPVIGQPTNLDFETGTPGNAPDGWNTTLVGLGFESTTTEDRPASGKRAAILKRVPQNYYGERAGSLTQLIDATAYRGKRVRLRVMALTDALGAGNHAYVRLEIGNPDGVGFDNLIGQPVESTAWRSYEIEADVPNGARTIKYGVYLIGIGRVWLDAVSIDIVAQTGAEVGNVPRKVTGADEVRNATVSETVSQVSAVALAPTGSRSHVPAHSAVKEARLPDSSSPHNNRLELAARLLCARFARSVSFGCN